MEFRDTRITLGRPLSDYTKVQFFYSYFIRNNRAQINSLPEKDYVNIGCGPNIYEQFINVDYQWRPGIHVCWDISNGLPELKSDTYTGVYTEHCLEHIEFESCKKVLSDVYRVLKPEGILRIVVPDAELYLDLYQKGKVSDDIAFPYMSQKDVLNGSTPMMEVNRVFRDHGHRFAYDFQTFAAMLKEAGYIDIKRQKFMCGDDDNLLVDSESRKVESLYIEARKAT